MKTHNRETTLPIFILLGTSINKLNSKYGGRSLPVKMEFFLATVTKQLSQGFLFNAFALRRLLVPLDSKYIKLRSVSPEQSPNSSEQWKLSCVVSNQHLLWAPISSWGDWDTGPALCLLLPVGDTGESHRKGCVGARGSSHFLLCSLRCPECRAKGQNKPCRGRLSCCLNYFRKIIHLCNPFL